jgi:serine phosphatase RsbU (regulator of sigma subunit)/integral membrane sensor domain MASE1/anti-sigma regulatory factor (Ser/Thr protein kinase)
MLFAVTAATSTPTHQADDLAAATPRGGGRPFVRYILTLIAIGAVYFITARLSLHLSLVGLSVTPVWPPTGIALVGFLLLGYRVWPAVAVAAFLVNWHISPNAGTAAAIAVGNTAAPAFATLLLRLARFRPDIDRTRDAMALVILGALAGMTVSATIGAYSLHHSGAPAHTDFWETWAVWWTGDAMGILAVAPFLLGIRSLRWTGRISWGRAAEAVAVFGVLAATATLVNTTPRPMWVAVFPILVWIAWRYQQRGSGPAALLVIGLASWAAAHNSGPFAGAELLSRMVSLQTFNAAVALTSFFLAAVVAERSAARLELVRSSRELYLREHHIAETLQRSLLPLGLPDTPDVAIAARYIPASSDAEVGGDWYDIAQLPDGRIGLSIGDVAGHGVAAAAAMGQIRTALRAYTQEMMSPAHALERLNSLLQQLQPGAMATLAYGHMDPETGLLTLAKAGHPPPLIMTTTGESRFIVGGLAPPLGVAHVLNYEETTVELEAGSTLVLYTDGLIERRGESLAAGMARLAQVTAEAPNDLEAASDHIIASLLGDGVADDTAILMIRRPLLAGRPLRLTFPAEPIRLSEMRHALGRWLRRNAVDSAIANDVTLACTEACTNAIQHAYGSREGKVEVEASISGTLLTVTVRDFGTWRSVEPKVEDETGRGLDLIRSLMEGVEIFPSSDGSDIRMTRRIGAL